jgi:hypothetical protein
MSNFQNASVRTSLLKFCSIFFLFILLPALFQTLFCSIHIHVPYPVFSIPCQHHCSRCYSCKCPHRSKLPIAAILFYIMVPPFPVPDTTACCSPCFSLLPSMFLYMSTTVQYRCCHMLFRFMLRIDALAFQSACSFYSCNCIRYPLISVTAICYFQIAHFSMIAFCVTIAFLVSIAFLLFSHVSIAS